jgi:hypothetical protein
VLEHPLVKEPKELKLRDPGLEPIPYLLFLLNPNNFPDCLHLTESACRFLQPARHHDFLELLVMTLEVF